MSWFTVRRIFKSSQCMKIFCIPLFLTITIAAVIMHFALHHGSNIGKPSNHRIPMHSYFIFKDRFIVFVAHFICILLTLGRLDLYQFEFGYTENTYFTEDNSETKQNRVFRKLKNQSLSFSTLLSANGSEAQSSVTKVFEIVKIWTLFAWFYEIKHRRPKLDPI